MDNYETKCHAKTISNISEVSTVQETIDIKIDNIKEKNIKIESINLNTQPINNLPSPGISKKIWSKICKVLCIIICLVSLLFILTFFYMIFACTCCIPPNERIKPPVYEIYNMTNNTKEFDNNY